MLVQNAQMYQIFKLANETLSFKDEETFWLRWFSPLSNMANLNNFKTWLQICSCHFFNEKSIPSLTNFAAKWGSHEIGFFGKSRNLWSVTGVSVGLVSITTADMGLLFSPPLGFTCIEVRT